MTVTIKITGKGEQVFRFISLLATHCGKDTIGKIVEEKGPGTLFLLCRGNEFDTSLTGLYHEDTPSSRLM